MFLNLHGFCHFELISSYILENMASNESINPCAEGAKIFFGTFIWKNIFFMNIFMEGPIHTLAFPFSPYGRALLPWKISLRSGIRIYTTKIFSCFIRTKGMGLICILVSSIRTIAPKAQKIFGNKPPKIISSTYFTVFYHNLRKIQNNIIKKYFL